MTRRSSPPRISYSQTLCIALFATVLVPVCSAAMLEDFLHKHKPTVSGGTWKQQPNMPSPVLFSKDWIGWLEEEQERDRRGL